MRRVVLPRVVAFVLSIVLLSSSGAAWAGTVTKTFPDLEEHVAMFFKFPLGMTQREFRTRVPTAWHIAPPVPGDLPQNTNARGEINKGWFGYAFFARGTYFPWTYFYFWEGKLVYAELDSRTSKREFGQAHYDAGVSAAIRFRALYGSGEKYANQVVYSESWNAGQEKALVNVKNFASLPYPERPLALLHIVHNKPREYAAWRKWIIRRPDQPPNLGPLVGLYCRSSSDGDGENILMEIDTRGLTTEKAREVLKLKLKEMTAQGYQCDGDVGNNVVADTEANMHAAKQRQAHTYLYYIDENDLAVTQRFKTANVNIEDSVCEEFRDRLAPALRATAECVTGTDVWQQDP